MIILLSSFLTVFPCSFCRSVLVVWNSSVVRFSHSLDVAGDRGGREINVFILNVCVHQMTMIVERTKRTQFHSRESRFADV